MTQAGKYCVVLTTTGNQEEADRLARSLIDRKLAACVQVTSITSYYVWNDKVNKEPELLLLIKTTDRLYREVEAFIAQNHSYEVPEIVQVPINKGLESYLHWLEERTNSSE
jgi:periplasmic divalent cation tolerance protein